MTEDSSRECRTLVSSAQSDEALTNIISLLSDFGVTVAQKRQHLAHLPATIRALAERKFRCGVFGGGVNTPAGD
jgi:hypothetical protein